jgi:RNA polymerase sigma-70 factor, ECF subfamily
VGNSNEHLAAFERLRPRLFGVAYRMTGSVVDAEDIVQDVYLAWTRQDLERIEEPGAYLTRCVVNRARDLLGSAQRQREHYVGPWLPEPLVRRFDRATSSPGLDAEVEGADAKLEWVESLQIALLLVLDRLGPDERAVFILKEVFGYRYAEISEVIGKTEVGCRKLGERARAKVRDQRPPVVRDPARTQAVMAAFFMASEGGDLEALTGLLRADAVLYSDGGGKVHAALKPVIGAHKIARFLVGIRKLRTGEQFGFEPVWVNDAPGIVLFADGQLDSCGTLDIDGEGRISAIYFVRNPDKLGAVARALGRAN